MEKVKIKNIFDFQKKSKIKAGDGFKLGEAQYPFYTSSNELTKSINEYLFEDESLIFGTGGLASIHFCNEKFAVSTDCFVIQPKDKKRVFSKFVYYYLSGNMNILESGFKGAGLKHISKDYLENIEIPLPNLATQQRIAAILDQADAIIQNNRAIVQKYDQLTQSLFLDMFGDPVRNVLDFEEIELINLIKDKNDIKCGPFGTQLSKSEYVEFGVPVWGIPQVNSLFVKKPTEYVTKKKAEILKQYSVFPDDIVMSRKGNVGKCAIYPNNWEIGILHSDVLRIRCDKDKISPVFLVWQFRISRRLETQVNDVSSGAIMQGINVSKLKNILAIVPPIALQNHFAERVAMIESQKQQAQLELAKSEELFQCLLQRAFKGELN
ncbi:restriction endonuclease subunit S [Cloacibacterium normanense]|uniref:restriction endonuclease subunit S n=1 Tax=Cloacibacterium normanense TaxID=237258 RepID=UPI00352DDB06